MDPHILPCVCWSANILAFQANTASEPWPKTPYAACSCWLAVRRQVAELNPWTLCASRRLLSSAAVAAARGCSAMGSRLGTISTLTSSSPLIPRACAGDQHRRCQTSDKHAFTAHTANQTHTALLRRSCPSHACNLSDGILQPRMTPPDSEIGEQQPGPKLCCRWADMAQAAAASLPCWCTADTPVVPEMGRCRHCAAALTALLPAPAPAWTWLDSKTGQASCASLHHD